MKQGARIEAFSLKKVLTKKRTYFKGVKINDLKNEDSFSAGLKFHSLVDEVRAKFTIALNRS